VPDAWLRRLGYAGTSAFRLSTTVSVAERSVRVDELELVIGDALCMWVEFVLGRCHVIDKVEGTDLKKNTSDIITLFEQ